MANRILTPGHMGPAATAISLMAAALAIGLHGLRWTTLGDDWFETQLMNLLPNETIFQLHSFAIWTACVVIAFGLTFTILMTPTWWRRLIIVTSVLILVLGWAPVMWLAHLRPSVSAILVTVIWSGMGSMIYASRHRMACDRNDTPEPS